MSTTRWYWAWRDATEVQASASSVPDAPPKETMASPPEARRVLTAPVHPASSIAVSPLKVALQLPPPLMTKASV